MNGNITMSRSGSTGRTSGIFGGSSSLRSSSAISSPFPSRVFPVPAPRYHRLRAPSILHPRNGDGEQAALDLGLGLPDVHRLVQQDGPGEAALRALHAEER